MEDPVRGGEIPPDTPRLPSLELLMLTLKINFKLYVSILYLFVLEKNSGRGKVLSY